jgi:hypothetical protein
LAAARKWRGETVTFFYISDGFENDIRRCIQSWERQDPITITGVIVEGRIKDLTGTVQAIDRDASRGPGRPWRVVIRV